MPPKRARASSSASANAAPTTSAAPERRRSSRVSIAPAPFAAPQNPPAPNGRARRASSALSSAKGSDDGDDAGPARKKPRGSSAASARVVKKDVAPKPPRPLKALKPPVQGMNTLPERWSLFPAPSSFSGAVGFEPVPAPGDAPRQVAIWGDGNMSGQLGMGEDKTEAEEPVRHSVLNKMIREQKPGHEYGVADVTAAGMHNLFVDGNGEIWSCGINDNATLGRLTAGADSDELESVPMPVQDQHAAIVDSKLKAAHGHPFKAVRCYAGDSISLAQDERGDIKMWGAFRDAQGLLGFSETVKRQWQPTALDALAKHSFVQVACGDDHYLALTTKGLVLTAGVGEQGQLGRRVFSRNPKATLTPERLALDKVVLVGAGAYHSFAVNEVGDVYGWGNNTYRQTGVDGGADMKVDKPTLVEGLSLGEHGGARVVQIAGGAFHSVFLFSNGEVWTVGRADEGECGLAVDHPEMAAMRQRRDDAEVKQAEWKQVERKKYFAEDGTTVDWYGDDDQLLTVDKVDAQVEQDAATEVPLPNNYIATPQRVDFPLEPATWDDNKTQADYDKEPELCTEPTRIIHVASAGQHTIAVSARGYVYTWGLGIMSQLGIPPIPSPKPGKPTPVERAATPTRILNTALMTLRAIKAEAGGQHCLVVGVSRDWVDKKRAREEKKRVEEEEKAAAAAAAADEADGGDVEMADGREGAEEENEERAAAPAGQLEPVVEA
ncbi:hypothetical protein JCM8208_000445 [Rhodotorula glutinis]